MNTIRTLYSISLLAICIACGPLVTTKITTYHTIERPLNGLIFAIVPSAEQRGSLEFQAFAKEIRNRLESIGMKEGPVESATIGVLFTYGIDNGRTITSSYPIFGVTGTSGSYTTGTATTYGRMTTFSASTTPVNTYGVTGFVPIEGTIYKRVLNLDMIDLKLSKNGQIQKVFEGKAVSSGSSGNIAEILPIMIDCVFENFPGKNGVTITCDKPFSSKK